MTTKAPGLILHMLKHHKWCFSIWRIHPAALPKMPHCQQDPYSLNTAPITLSHPHYTSVDTAASPGPYLYCPWIISWMNMSKIIRLMFLYLHPSYLYVILSSMDNLAVNMYYPMSTVYPGAARQGVGISPWSVNNPLAGTHRTFFRALHK